MYCSALLPSEVMPITGRGSAGSARAAWQAPTTAPAACASAAWHSRFSPYRPPAHSRIIRSGGMRSGGIRCECAMVDSTTFGTPSGSASATSSARSVPMVPPSASRPSMRPCACACRASVAAPWAISVIALFSSPLSATCCSVAPAAAATSVLVMSAVNPAGPDAAMPTPTSITSARAPIASMRSRRKAISSRLVSTVPISRMVGPPLTVTPPPPRTTPPGCRPARPPARA